MHISLFHECVQSLSLSLSLSRSDLHCQEGLETLSFSGENCSESHRETWTVGRRILVCEQQSAVLSAGDTMGHNKGKVH